jgi:hypothetical protein
MNIFKNFILYISKKLKAKATSSLSMNSVQLNVMENNTYENSNVGIHSDYNNTTTDKSFRRTILIYINLLETDVVGFSTKITKTVATDLPEFTVYKTIEKLTMVEEIIMNPYIIQFSQFGAMCIMESKRLLTIELIKKYNSTYDTNLRRKDIIEYLKYSM